MNIKANARPCDANEIVRQVGKGNVLAISGGRAHAITNDDNEVVGITLPINGTRRVDILLDWDDTYVVRRVRTIVRGEHRGDSIIEEQSYGIYCDQVGETAYRLSCWK